MRPKLRSLEILRAVAALLVVLFHSETIFATARHTPYGGLFSAGNRGVDLFFVLSSFIIAHVHWHDLGRPRCLGRYVFNRVSRIYPAACIMTLLALSLYALGFGNAAKAAKLDPTAIAASFLLLAQHGPPLVNVSWTLTYEVAFYAIFAVAIVHLRLGLALLLAWQAAALAFVISGEPIGLSGYYLRSICLEFSLGLAAAWWLAARPAARSRQGSWLVLALGLIAFLAGMALNRAIGWAPTFCAVGAAMMIIALVRLEQADCLPVPSSLVRLGNASYAVYIVHYSVITLLATVLVRKLHLPASDPLCLGCAMVGVCCGLGFHRYVDRPIQRGLRRWRDRKATASQPRRGAAMEPREVE